MHTVNYKWDTSSHYILERLDTNEKVEITGLEISFNEDNWSYDGGTAKLYFSELFCSSFNFIEKIAGSVGRDYKIYEEKIIQNACLLYEWKTDYIVTLRNAYVTLTNFHPTDYYCELHFDFLEREMLNTNNTTPPMTLNYKGVTTSLPETPMMGDCWYVGDNFSALGMQFNEGDYICYSIYKGWEKVTERDYIEKLNYLSKNAFEDKLLNSFSEFCRYKIKYR